MGVDGDALAGVGTRCRGVSGGEKRRSSVRLRRKDDKLDVVGCNLKGNSWSGELACKANECHLSDIANVLGVFLQSS